MPQISKFSFAEMFSNKDGKTSGSGTMGILTITIAIICFAYGCIIKDYNIINQCVVIIMLGFAALGVRKIVDKDAKTSDLGADTATANTTTSPEAE